MGRMMRRVPPYWKHPRYEGAPFSWDHSFIPLSDTDGMWDDDMVPMSKEDIEAEMAELHDWALSYMPNWPTEERTHYQYYEDTSDGTPLSPVFDTAEKVAAWLRLGISYRNTLDSAELWERFITDRRPHRAGTWLVDTAKLDGAPLTASHPAVTVVPTIADGGTA